MQKQLSNSCDPAYALQNKIYLLDSWHPSNHPPQLDLHTEAAKWIGLSIMGTQAGQGDDNEDSVEFIAHYNLNGAPHQTHEVNLFIKQQE